MANTRIHKDDWISTTGHDRFGDSNNVSDVRPPFAWRLKICRIEPIDNRFFFVHLVPRTLSAFDSPLVGQRLSRVYGQLTAVVFSPVGVALTFALCRFPY